MVPIEIRLCTMDFGRFYATELTLRTVSYPYQTVIDVSCWENLALMLGIRIGITYMSRSSTSLASGWVPESAYDEPTSPNDAQESLSPQRSSSHDEYNPSPRNTPPPTSSASDIHTTPSHQSTTVNISEDTRNALRTFYECIYGRDSKRCLVTQREEPLVIAHIVQRASKPDQVR
jgi:hypothetical protein